MAHIKRLLPEIYLLSKGNKMENTEIIIPKDKFVFVPLGGATGIGMNFFYMDIKENG